MTDGEYAWLTKYGGTKEEAFSAVKKILLDIIEASSSNTTQRIDNIDLGNAVKWKIANLHNPDVIVPIFKPEVLLRAAESLGFTGWDRRSVSQLHQYLISKKPKGEHNLDYAGQLWNQFNLANFYTVIEKFVNQAQTGNLKKQGYPTKYKDLDVRVSFGAGNMARIPWIAFLKTPNTITNGIYPVYLYYKSDNLLILAYCLSETNPPEVTWPNEDQLKTVGFWKTFKRPQTDTATLI